MLEVYVIGAAIFGAVVAWWMNYHKERYLNVGYGDSFDGEIIAIAIFTVIAWPLAMLPMIAGQIGKEMRKQKK